MTRGKKIAAAAVLACLGAGVTVWSLSGRFKKRLEEEARQQVIAYLSKRFDSDVQFEAMQLNLPPVSSLALYFKHGRGVMASVDGRGLVLRRKNTPNRPPLIRLPRFHFDLDLAILGGPVKRVQRLECDGLEINIPPKEDTGPKPPRADTGEAVAVVFDEIAMTDVVLSMWPKDPAKPPLRFDIHNLEMKEAGNKTAMTYDARLLNAKPPGEIHAVGGFGPWNAAEPGDTPLSGDYRFDNANLSVFRAIRGTLSSTGKFSGTLDSIECSGDANVPNFALKMANNPVPLSTHFEALVDGTNGNTTLKPVKARLGRTNFVTRGAIIRHEDLGRRSIELAVLMPNGDLRDVIRLATPGTPFMKGRLHLEAKIVIPPANGKVREKLRLAGNFSVSDALFLRDTVQDKVDELSRRGQGKPKNPEIDDVVSNLRGAFDMRDEELRFSSINFDVPGAGVALAGAYDLDGGKVDFHGDLKLTAKASQTMTGWKHWLVKPFDPIFSKNGAGTYIKIQVVGTAKNPQFGRERGGNDEQQPVTKKLN